MKNAAIKLSPAFEPALLRFWKAAFQRYRRPLAEGVGFFVPEISAPLFSPCFVTGNRPSFLRANAGISHFNEILPLGHGQRDPAPVGFRLDRQLYLGERRIAARSLAAGLRAQQRPLGQALHEEEELWPLLSQGFPADAPFLRTLLPFFAALDADFRVLFLEERGRRVGAVVVGSAGGAALVLNAVVAEEHRGRGLGGELGNAAESLAVRLGAEEAFYWAPHPFLGRQADRVSHYRIYSQASS